jgi:hypothetical protein
VCGGCVRLNVALECRAREVGGLGRSDRVFYPILAYSTYRRITLPLIILGRRGSENHYFGPNADYKFVICQAHAILGLSLHAQLLDSLTTHVPTGAIGECMLYRGARMGGSL